MANNKKEQNDEETNLDGTKARRLTKHGLVDKRVKYDQSEEIKRIVYYMVDSGTTNLSEVSQGVGIPLSRIRYYKDKNEYLKEFVEAGRMKASMMIPKALKAVDESLEAKSEDVKLRAGIKVLESQDILKGQRIDVHHHDQSIEEIAKELREAGMNVPERTVLDAEVIE